MLDPRFARGMAAQLEARRTLLATGAQPFGWKVGFGSAAAMARLGTTAPLVGFLTTRSVVQAGSTVCVDGWSNPVLEPEIAVHIGRDLGVGADVSTVERSIAGLGPAIELADVYPPPEDVERILAGNIFHRQVVVGPPDGYRGGGSVERVRARVLQNGVLVAETDDPEALTGRLTTVAREVADLLGSLGDVLREGAVVIAGSVVPPLRVATGDQVRVEFQHLGDLELRFA
jgi:2-keto-4-pentenoate hydratase